MNRVVIFLEECNTTSFITDRWKLFFEALNINFGFKFYPFSLIPKLEKVELEKMEIILLCISSATFRRFPSQILDKVRARGQAKLILYVYDLWDESKGFDGLLLEADVILSTTNKEFKNLYPTFVDKMEFFPSFFSPHWRYNKFFFNKDPKMKCLLVGKIEHIYPLRMFIKKECDKNESASRLVDILPTYGLHSGLHIEATTKAAFAEKLHDYFCVVSSSVSNYVVAKTVEICATGALLLTDDIPDMRFMGFVPFKNFIPVTSDTVFSRISECLKYPNAYTTIRKAGMRLAKKDHSIRNRIRQFGEIINDLGKGEIKK